MFCLNSLLRAYRSWERSQHRKFSVRSSLFGCVSRDLPNLALPVPSYTVLPFRTTKQRECWNIVCIIVKRLVSKDHRSHLRESLIDSSAFLLIETIFRRLEKKRNKSELIEKGSSILRNRIDVFPNNRTAFSSSIDFIYLFILSFSSFSSVANTPSDTYPVPPFSRRRC